MPVEGWLYGLLGLMILGSLITLEMKDVLGSIVAVGIVGLLLAVCFLLLQAPDLAIVQFIYEIPSVIILVMAFAGREKDVLDQKRDLLSPGLAVLFLLPFLVMGYFALRDLPSFGAPLLRVATRYLARGAGETGAANLVTAILLDYRVYDTLGEATVIFTGILGAITIIRKVGRKG
ncbi:MAG: hydrogen gas-evolving membrane-bound hydrogenase subunit E [Bacillota bacterium]